MVDKYNKIDSSDPIFTTRNNMKPSDPLSPKLFTSVIEEVFRNLTVGWKEKGIVVDEKRLKNRFADDIVLFSSSATKLQTMFEDLSKAKRASRLSWTKK